MGGFPFCRNAGGLLFSPPRQLSPGDRSCLTTLIRVIVSAVALAISEAPRAHPGRCFPRVRLLSGGILRADFSLRHCPGLLFRPPLWRFCQRLHLPPPNVPRFWKNP